MDEQSEVDLEYEFDEVELNSDEAELNFDEAELKFDEEELEFNELEADDDLDDLNYDMRSGEQSKKDDLSIGPAHRSLPPDWQDFDYG